MMRRLAPLLSLVLAAGCGAPTAIEEPFQFGEPFWVPVGRVAISADASTVVHFVRVISDSRCPGGDIVCVWAGEAKLELGVAVPPAAETRLEITLGGTSMDNGVGTAQGRSIEVLALE